jgi:very-long-chain ceramide synthase
MSDHSATVEYRNEKTDAANGRFPDTGNNVGIGQELNLGAPEQFQTHTMTVKRKAKRKEDSPLEILCRWLVEHQVGTSMLSDLQTRSDD